MDLTWVDEAVAAWGAPHHERREPVRIGNEWMRSWIWPHHGHIRIVEPRLTFGQRIEARGPNGRAEYVAPLGRGELTDEEVRAVLALAGVPASRIDTSAVLAGGIYCGRLRVPPSAGPWGRSAAQRVVQVCTRRPHAPDQPCHWRTIDGRTNDESKLHKDLTRQGLVTNV